MNLNFILAAIARMASERVEDFHTFYELRLGESPKLIESSFGGTAGKGCAESAINFPFKSSTRSDR